MGGLCASYLSLDIVRSNRQMSDRQGQMTQRRLISSDAQTHPISAVVGN